MERDCIQWENKLPFRPFSITVGERDKVVSIPMKMGCNLVRRQRKTAVWWMLRRLEEGVGLLGKLNGGDGN